MKLSRIAFALIFAALMGAIIFATDRSAPQPATASAKIPDSAQPSDETALAPRSNRLEDQLKIIDLGAWVTILDPEQTASGYVLAAYERRLPFLMDLDGRVVHTWPSVRMHGRSRLSPEGELITINTDDEIVKYDWDGRLLFKYVLPKNNKPHHDLIWLRNGNILFLAHSGVGLDSGMRDYILEVDSAGATVWRWDFEERENEFPTWNPKKGNPTHANSVHELGENPHFDAGDQRFRPGNLLVSARNLDTIFVIDKASGEVVWRFDEGLDHQHEALMFPAGHPRAGQIILFNNGLNNRDDYRRSRVQIFDPQTNSKLWEFTSPLFFSPVSSLAQPLWNGNLFVTSSHGGRLFEMTPNGKIVWQWEPPYQPMRPSRYPPDYCPQLAELDAVQPLARMRDTPYVDKALYDFLLSSDRSKQVPGRVRRELIENQVCRQLLIPSNASLVLEYGLHRETLGEEPFAARFVAEIRSKDQAQARQILGKEISSKSENIKGRTQISLAQNAYETVELCLDAQAIAQTDGVDPAEAIFWLEPRITSSSEPDPDDESKLSKAELELQLEDLRSIGYIQ